MIVLVLIRAYVEYVIEGGPVEFLLVMLVAFVVVLIAATF